MIVKRLICLLLALSISLSLCACGGGIIEADIVPTEVSVPVAAAEDSEPIAVASASEMKLVKTVGGVHVMDDGGVEQPLIPSMNLYSGYGVGTGDSSYAWINLDDAKLLKMDEQSRASFQKNGRKLKVNLSAGKIFFCILESLEEDEALEFSTPNLTNMVMAVRGTTGFVEVVSDHETRITLLEGKIDGTAVPGSFEMDTGKLTDIIVPCKTGMHDIGEEESGIETREIDYDKDVPPFVMDEIQNNPDIKDKIDDNGGFTDYPEGATDEPVDETTHEYSYRKEFIPPTCVDEGYTLHTCICGFNYKDDCVDPMGHLWGKWNTIKEPTALEDGLAEHFCSRCAAVETRILHKLTSDHTHSYTTKVTDATCTRSGFTTYTCACGDTFDDDYVNPLGHQWSDWITVIEPTETTEGTAERTCGRCGGKESRTLPVLIPGHTHSYVAEITRESSCYSDGIMVFTCACGDTYTEMLETGYNHEFVMSEEKYPTCFEDGYRKSVCQKCGEIKMENWQAVGHRWSDWITTTEPTESSSGTAVRNCNGCGAEETRVLPQLVPGHTHEYMSEVTVTPTCTSEGLMTYTCVCGDTYTENMNMTRHLYNHGYGEDSTCTEAGYWIQVCGTCGHTIRRDTLPTGHAWGVWVTITEPTETSTGLAEHTCTECGYKESKVLDQSDSSHIHQYVETDRQESTCDVEGYRSYACTCGSTLTQKLPTKGHPSKTQIIDPTCTEDGAENLVCTLCGYVETRRVIPAMGHSWGAWVMVQPPTENIEGYAERTCSRCSATETKSLPPVSADHTHTYSEETALRPTCTTEGIKSFICECGDTYTEPISATGHDFWHSGGKEPSCTEGGQARYTCLMCDFVKTEPLPPTGHNWGEWVTIQEPDVGVEGLAQRTCSWCNNQETKVLDALPAPPPETIAEDPPEASVEESAT